MIKAASFIWLDGHLVPWADAKIHVLSHALHYGTGAFEGIRSYPTAQGDTVLFRARAHLDRLLESARLQRIALSYTTADLLDATKSVVRENKLSSAYIRPIVFLGYGSLALDEKDEVPTQTAIAAFDWGRYLGGSSINDGIDVCVSSWVKAPGNAWMASVKASGGYLPMRLANKEAHQNGYGEAIMLDSQGNVSEGAGENLFVVHKGVLIAPPAAADILLGITRDTVIELARREGIEVQEREFPRASLYVAEEAFLTGTATEICPIRSIDRIPLGRGTIGPITLRLQQRFYGLFSGETPDPAGWLEKVCS